MERIKISTFIEQQCWKILSLIIKFFYKNIFSFNSSNFSLKIEELFKFSLALFLQILLKHASIISLMRHKLYSEFMSALKPLKKNHIQEK